jgi:MFS family permease
MFARDGLAAWTVRWRPVFPLLAAEFIVWLGFGGLLPVLPLWVTEHGVDLATMGVIVAAWPVARLVGEPAFGWLADRTARKPLMVGGLLALALFTVIQVWLTTPVAFFLLRGLSGLATSAFDPAARGFLSDSTPRDRQGEAFGLYGSAAMGGLILGPAIGGLAAAATGSLATIFFVTAAMAILAAIPIALFIREEPARTRHPALGPAPLTELPPDDPGILGRAAEALVADEEREQADQPGAVSTRPTSLWNRALGGAVVITLGENYAVGTYEVIWSLWLVSLGAGLELIGLTFALFGVPVLFLSPIAGRLVDRGHTRLFVVAASIGLIVSGILYGLIEEPILVAAVILFEATCVAFLSPTLFAIVASGSPRGRSSTAQGLFGAAGTVGFIIASLSTGLIASVDLRLPFFVFAVVMAILLVIGLAVGRDKLAVRPTMRT